MIDIHSHILPGVDDGAAAPYDSAELLKQMQKQGVTVAAATPHFYPGNMAVDDYIETRARSLDSIKKSAEECGIKILLGAEVLYFHGIGSAAEISKLTIEGGKYLIVELLGLNCIDDHVIKDIENIRNNFGITPIIAHIERYCKYKGYKKLFSLIDDGVALSQINATFFLSFSEKRAVKKLIKSGRVHFVASDCHHPKKRPVYLKKAFEVIRDISEEQYNRILKSSDNIERELLAAYEKQNG